jgi:hypothetical protein
MRVKRTKERNSMHSTLDLNMHEIEMLDAPGIVEWVTGIAVGIVVGGAALYGGVAIGVAIT